MHFKSYNPKSIFTEPFNGQDRHLFDLAYKRSEPSMAVRTSVARNWVNIVLHIAADRLGLQFSQMVHAFESGDSQAVRMVYAHRLPIHQDQLRQTSKLPDGEAKSHIQAQISEAIKTCEHVTQGMDDADIKSWIREKMVEALSVSHPQTNYKEAYLTKKAKRDPSKPRQEKKKPTVEHKRPHAAGAV